MSAAKRKGSAWERRLVDFLRANGHPQAERRVTEGRKDRGDVSGIPGWVLEAKNCRVIELGPWMDEARKEALRDGSPCYAVVFPRRNHTTAEAFAVLPLWLLAQLMRENVNDPGPKEAASA